MNTQEGNPMQGGGATGTGAGAAGGREDYLDKGSLLSLPFPSLQFQFSPGFSSSSYTLFLVYLLTRNEQVSTPQRSASAAAK